MKKITEFNIDTSDFAATTLSRQYNVVGQKDAEFILQVFNSSQQFYNFTTKSFSATQTTTSSLQVKMKSSNFIGNINFPANGSGDTYTILLLTPSNKDTELSFGQGKNSYSITITQLANAIITFTPSSATSVNYETLPTTTSTASPVSTNAVTKAISWDLVNKKHNSYGFGLRLTRQPLAKDWYYEKDLAISSNPAGDAVSNNTVIVGDLTDIATGMELIYHKGTTAPSATTIVKAIDLKTKTITFSTNTAFEDGETMKFRAYGPNIIRKAIGVDLDLSNWKSTVDTITLSKHFTKRVRATGTNTVIALDNTYGLTGGGHVRVRGLNVVNTSVNKIQSVVADVDGTGGNGTITVQVNQTAALSVGTVLKFFAGGIGKGSRDQLKASNNIIINSYPSSNKTIHLDLDKFITIGTIS